jgi:hypothetical protein
MSNKIFTAVPNPNLQAEDWTPRGRIYDLREISEINTGDGGGNIPDPTSIPTPFARIDLFLTAFEQARVFLISQRSGRGNENQNSWFNIKVSHVFDLMYLLYQYKRYNQFFEIITWDRGSNIQELKSSSNVDIKRFGKTLELYLEADKDTYNFNSLDKFHIIKWRNGKVIGGSSPVTILFTSGNDLQEITQGVQVENWAAFDNSNHPLHSREYDFQLYIHQLAKTFNNKFRAVRDYLEESKQTLSSEDPALYQKLVNDLQNSQGNFNGHYQPIVSTNGQNFNFCNFELYQVEDSKDITIEDTSLLIKSAKAQLSAPILIPNFRAVGHRYPGNQNYDNVQFPNEAKKIIEKEEKYLNRTLPKNGKSWPFIAIDDILENELFVLDFQPDRSAFFMPHSDLEAPGYLLPIKPLFFEFFSIEELIEGTLNGNKNLPSIEVNSTKSDGNSLWEIVLNIPTKAKDSNDPGQASFQRKYGNISGSGAETRGKRIDVFFNTRIFPFVQFAGEYRIGIAAENVGEIPAASWNLKYLLTNSNSEFKIFEAEKHIREQVANSSIYFRLEENFDVLRLYSDDLNSKGGLLIPILKKPAPKQEKLKFAIDFGTTNTHIEFGLGAMHPEPLSYKTGDGFIGDLMSDKFRNQQFKKFRNSQFEKEFLPYELSNDSTHAFPRRSVLCYKLGNITDYKAYLNANFAFDFDLTNESLGFELDLKWGKTNRNAGLDSRLNAEFESITMMIWAKALALGISFSEISIIWFFPSSMLPGRRNVLKAKWEAHILDYLKGIPKESIISISESRAPFAYYMKQQGVLGAGTHVIFDMGGGTTDFLIYSDGKVAHQTSSRFAGLHFFGNGANNPYSKNGFLKAFENKIQASLESIYLGGNVPSAVNELEKWADPDVGSYLFGLGNRGSNKRFDFANELSNFHTDLKAIPLLAVLSITFYSAKLIKNLSLGSVKSLMFSGNSSKILSIIDPDPGYKSSVLKIAIERVFNSVLVEQSNDFKIYTDSKPKTLTAKGGIYYLDPNRIQNETPEPVFTVGNLPYEDKDLIGIRVRDIIESEIEKINEAFADLSLVLKSILKNPDLDGISVNPDTWDWLLGQLESKSMIKDVLQQVIIEEGEDARLMEEPWLFCLGGLLGRFASEIAFKNHI